MSQTNNLQIEERSLHYSQFNVKELELQLLEETSYQNRNIIRQVIRKKRKIVNENNEQLNNNTTCNEQVNNNKIDKEKLNVNEMDREKTNSCKAEHEKLTNNQTESEKVKTDNIQEIEKLKESLNNTEDFFEQCRIRSTILYLQKNSKKIELKQKTKIDPVLEEKIIPPVVEKPILEINIEPTCIELIYDEMLSTGTINHVVVSIDNLVKLIWIMPFKILTSIEYSWHFNEEDINISHSNRVVVHFDGKRAILTLADVKITDSGIYKVTIHSQRLKRKSLKFQLVVNDINNLETSSIIVEEPELKSDKAVVPIEIPSYDPIVIPRVGINKNRFNRHKTMIGEDMMESRKFVQNKMNNSDKIEELIFANPPKQNVKRFNRSATSARDIVLTFCKLNTDEYNEYGVCVENLSSSWADGLAFCALIHHFHPEAFDFSTLNKSDRRSNFELAFNSADKYAEIYPLLDIDDMLMMERPDWKCIFTYVQCFYKTFRTHPKNKLKTIPIS